MMRVIIDRFEEEYAIAELDGEMLRVPRALFAEAQEGDHVEITVLGKPHKVSERFPDNPSSFFERLRQKSKGEKTPPADPADS